MDPAVSPFCRLQDPLSSTYQTIWDSIYNLDTPLLQDFALCLTGGRLRTADRRAYWV